MIVFYILIAWFLIALLISQNIRVKDKRKIYCLMLFIPMLIIMGFRSQYTAGNDTYLSYVPTFLKICNCSLKQVIELYQGKDLFFYIVTKIFSYFCNNYQIYLFAISLFVLSSLFIFVYRYSENILLSIILYCALGYYGISFQMLRHALAVAVLLFAYKYLVQRSVVKFTLVVLIASLFHISACAFLIAYPIWKLKIGWKQYSVLFFVIFGCMYYKNIILRWIVLFLGDNIRYQQYLSSDYQSQLNITGALILTLIFIVSRLFLIKNHKKIEILDMENGLLNMSILSIIFMVLVVVIGEFHRISMFFGIYNILLLPKALSKLKNTFLKEKRYISIIYLVIGTIFILYFLIFQIENAGLDTYHFCWQVN